MEFKFFASIVGATLLTSCASVSLYNTADCEVPPEQYGRCFADLGYNPTAYEQLVDFCKAQNRPMDKKIFIEARTQRLAEVCSQPQEIFTLAFRAAYGVNGPEVCPKELLVSADQQKANHQGYKAGVALNDSQEKKSRIGSAEERRDQADEQGFLSGLEDRLLQESPEELKRSSETAAENSKKLRDLYPSIELTSLTQRRRCSPNGNF